MTSWFSQPSRPLARRATPIVAAVAAAALIVAGCTADKPKQVTPPNRILQSVAVQMSPNGTTTSIDGTAVSVRDDAGDATTQTTDYSPRKVADDLPVRVSTSYRTAKRSGTDLSELTGYSGRVEIDVTVQNLTIKPRDLTYDVAGSSKKQAAMVGAPMTVVASTSLPDTSPTDVVTASASDDSTVTNGVLSQSEKGGSVVQWAALLAAPQTTSNATLRLVTDAKDFTVPTIDLSVQPGLVTDPSVGGVLDNAFDSNPSSQLALEQRTIKVITDVNQVLTRASGNISSVRKNLKSTSNTLGKHSVEELKTSTKGVATSMKGLDKELKGLNSDISDTLDGTQSSVLSELGQTVSTMDQMLGDTSGGAPTAQVDGSGCKTKVKSPSDSDTVYGNLMQVTAQLDGYASATGQCKEKAQQALVRSVGPEKPSEETCGDTPSTTCSLYYTEEKFSSIMSDLVKQGDDLVNSLQPEVVDNANNEYDSLSGQVDAAVRAVDKLSKFDPTEDMDSRLKKVDTQLDVVDGKVDALEDHLSEIHDDAASGVETADANQQRAQEHADEINDADGPKDDLAKQTKSVKDQNEQLAKEICDLADNPLFGDIQRTELNHLRGYLDDDKCPKSDGPGPGDQDPGNNDSDDTDSKDGSDSTGKKSEIKPLENDVAANDQLTSTLKEQNKFWNKESKAWKTEADAWGTDSDAWSKIAKLTDVDNKDSKASKDLQKIRDQINLTRSRVKSVQAAVVTTNDGYAKLLGPVQDSVDTLSKNKQVMGDDLKKLSKQQRQLGPTINKAFNKAADDANKNVSKAIDPQIRKVTAQAQVDSEAVGDMFDESASGLSNAADQINRNGTETIEQQRKQLEAAEKGATGAAKKQINQSLSQMAKGVSASTRDMNGASTQLTASLKKVLLDLGTRKVKGSGLLGAMTTSAAKVGTADYQLALASDSATSYAGVRSEDIGGILLRQAQLQASLQASADLPAFHLDVPSGAQSQTVYSFEIGPPEVTKGRLVALIAVIAVVVIAAASGIVWWRTHPSKPKTQPAAADPVAISVPDAPRKLTIGMIVTLSSKTGQGADDKYAAEGAQVAATRLSMGGVTVEMKTVDDKGTTDGAKKAVKQLAAKNVSGIVAASQGTHLKGAVSAAAKADIPLLLPYESDARMLDDNSWTTGLTDSTIGKALHTALSAAKLTKPLVIDAGGGVPDTIDPTDKLSFAAGGDTAALIKKAKRVAKPGGVDCVLITGPADPEATVMAALQGASINLPTYLTPDATSQAFSDALAEAGGSLSSNLATVGPNWGDPAALQSDDDGRAMSSFLTAVRLTADDSNQTTLMGDQPFSVAVNAADTRSHDAVIALVQAAAAAKSGTAAEVAKSLSGLKLGHADGLAGPDLDFGNRTALVPQSVVTLRSSDQDLGLRPTATGSADSDSGAESSSGARLIWFAQPTTK